VAAEAGRIRQLLQDRGSDIPGLQRAVGQAFSGPPRVWLLTAALAAAAIGMYVLGVRNLSALESPVHLEWWIVAAMYGLAEVLVVHLQFRRDTHSFSLSEIPLLVGLFFLEPTMLVVALLLGSTAALTIHRRQRPLKLAFNLANLSFTTGLAIVLFRAILGTADPLGPAGWTAAFAAAIGADFVSLVMITGAISLATGKPPGVTQLLGSGSIASFFNSCLALVIVTVLWIHTEAAWLPLVLAGLMSAAYRIYGSVRRKHESLEVLYESTRRLQESSDVDRAVETLLSQARDMFRAGQAEILLFPTADEPGLEATIGEDETLRTSRLDSVDPKSGVWARVAAEGRGVCLPRPITNDRLRDHFAARGIRDAMVAPLFGQDAVVGTILTANRRSDVSTFGNDDLKLFETFANQASASLENARLIERLRRHAEETEHQALHDPLTGLPNRAFFHQAVQGHIATQASSNDPVAVLLMDLDRFKEVNDTLGHHNGDLLLQAVAARLRSAVRPGDVVARLGGDEFGILLTETPDRDAAEVLAARLIEALATPFLVHELTLDVGASVGIALYPDHGRDVDTLLQRADVAMYQAKGNLRGHVTYSQDQDSYNPDRLVLLGELRTAIENRELSVVYQPKVELATGRVVGAEALVRWPHPRRGLINPDDFIPLAEHTGLIRPLTLYVLEAALAECAGWRAGGFEIDVAVNLSVRNLLDVGLPDDIQRELVRNSLPSGALELEITESALVADPGRTNAVLQLIHELGVGISIDDFGTGYSSLSYLRQMPVDELKIDKSFVTAMAVDDNDALIVRSTIELGRNLGLRVVAEGIETREVSEQLASLGCHVGQGYYFGRPLSADQFLRKLSSGPIAPATPESRRVTRLPRGRLRPQNVRVLRPTAN
jgi:diguanylate cyclase (GGDEF)-like protein